MSARTAFGSTLGRRDQRASNAAAPEGRPMEGRQLGHRLAVPRHGEVLATLDAVDDLAPVIPELADRDLRHVSQGITRETCPRRGPVLRP